MKPVSGLAAVLTLAALTLAPPPAARAADGKIAVVAAENFYGDIAKQIGGDHVAVASIMSNPDQDPHLFETTPGTVARSLAGAQIVIFNGADYDPWMAKTAEGVAAVRPSRIIAASTSSHKKAGDNPHLWYDPPTMPAAAQYARRRIHRRRSRAQERFEARLKTFLASLKPIDDKIAAIRKKYAGAPVTASEPVFGYMAQALGLKMRNESFQLSIMNDTEPSAHDVAAFEDDLKTTK